MRTILGTEVPLSDEVIDESEKSRLQNVINHAYSLMHAVQKTQRLGLKPLSIDDFTPREYELLSYLTDELDRLRLQKSGKK